MDHLVGGFCDCLGGICGGLVLSRGGGEMSGMKESIDRFEVAHAAYAMALVEEARRARRYGNACLALAVLAVVAELAQWAWEVLR